jgi:hypothetical protein
MGEVNNSCLKLIIYIFNLVLLLVGAALVTIGSLFLTIFAHDFHFARFSVQAASIAFIVIGSALILFSILGVLVTRLDQRALVGVHIIGLLLAFVALTVLGVWGLLITYNGTLEATTKEEIINSMENFHDLNTESVEFREVEWLQKRFQCCGFNSSDEWSSRNFTDSVDIPLNDKLIMDFKSRNQSLYAVPDSCCVEFHRTCGAQYPLIEKIQQRGCFEPFYGFLSKDMKIICGIACALALLSLISIAFLTFVCLSLRGDYTLLNSN